MILVKFFLALIFLLPFEKSMAAEISALKITESYHLPADEISGMAWRINPQTKRRELLVVGDSNFKIFIVDWDSRSTKGLKYQTKDLSPLKKPSLGQKSEYESVYSDGTGRVFLIKEAPPQVIVLSPNLDTIESTIDLIMTKEEMTEHDWPSQNNSGAEGIMPLKNGHILVVKEKNPLRIFEFAPRGSSAQGYKKDFSIEAKATFALPKEKTSAYHLVSSWKLDSKDDLLLEDSSGLNTNSDGTLYILGDQRNLIGRMGDTLIKSKNEVQINHYWSLPSVIEQPEGMVIDEKNRPIIAVDRKLPKTIKKKLKTDFSLRENHNIFLLDELKEN